MKLKNLAFYTALINITDCDNQSSVRGVWTKEQASEWYKQKGWLRGCNFIPSTAINQLEMWQAETFDPITIDRELGWAESIGMNCMRVYLHHLAWETDRDGFKNRMKTYLDIASNHHIQTIFVFMDDCWNPNYSVGRQPEPKPGVHNSGWISDPGALLYRDPTLLGVLETYVKDVMTEFKDDSRIVLWDLYNEPGNGGGETVQCRFCRSYFSGDVPLILRNLCRSESGTTNWKT
jgi:hypothetical protein